MKTYIQNMSKKGLAISSLIVGFLIGVLIVGIATAEMRDGKDEYRYKKAGMHGDMKMSGNMSDMMSGDKSGGMMHDMHGGSGMSMDEMMKGMMMGLEGKTGLAFDQAFLSEMIVHHQGAVEMARQVLTTSKRPELIKLANDIIKAQEAEIEMMKKWQTEWVK